MSSQVVRRHGRTQVILRQVLNVYNASMWCPPRRHRAVEVAFTRCQDAPALGRPRTRRSVAVPSRQRKRAEYCGYLLRWGITKTTLVNECLVQDTSFAPRFWRFKPALFPLPRQLAPPVFNCSHPPASKDFELYSTCQTPTVPYLPMAAMPKGRSSMISSRRRLP